MHHRLYLPGVHRLHLLRILFGMGRGIPIGSGGFTLNGCPLMKGMDPSERGEAHIAHLFKPNMM